MAGFSGFMTSGPYAASTALSKVAESRVYEEANWRMMNENMRSMGILTCYCFACNSRAGYV